MGRRLLAGGLYARAQVQAVVHTEPLWNLHIPLGIGVIQIAEECVVAGAPTCTLAYEYHT